jgi:hypothetical protein
MKIMSFLVIYFVIKLVMCCKVLINENDILFIFIEGATRSETKPEENLLFLLFL